MGKSSSPRRQEQVIVVGARNELRAYCCSSIPHNKPLTQKQIISLNGCVLLPGLLLAFAFFVVGLYQGSLWIYANILEPWNLVLIALFVLLPASYLLLMAFDMAVQRKKVMRFLKESLEMSQLGFTLPPVEGEPRG